MLNIQPDLEPIPGYRLIERLGRGGCGEVWKAEAPGGILKAIKFVHGDNRAFSTDASAVEQERKSLHRVKAIRHPFILSIERFEIIDGQLIIVMELADKNLHDRFNECAAQNLPGIPREELLRYLEEAAEALDLMNTQHQIQHLDVKPQNIFLVHQHVKVADFGLAKDLEGARAALTGGMTPMYAPPETFDGWVSRQSDQYSLAIVYQELLTGRRPFNGSNTRQLIMQHLTAPPDLSSLPAADKGSVAKALSKVPADRFPSCSAFIRALRLQEGPRSFSSSSSALLTRPGTVGDAKTDPIIRAPAPAAVPAVRRSDPSPVSPPSVPTPNGNGSGTRWPIPRNGDGILFPALIVGVGGNGLAVLRHLRQLVLDRYGKGSLPHFRWLFIDTDPKGIAAAQDGPKDLALSPDETLLAPPHPPAHYQNRDDLSTIDSRLSDELLGRLPATPCTHGRRGLGRLALGDHYIAVRDHFKTALESFTRHTAISEAEQRLRLGIRSTTPRVFLAATVGGGTGSGMVIDLAYLARQELLNLGMNPEHVIGLLALPAAAANGEDTPAVANARSFLEELRHHDRPETTYERRIGPVSESIADAGRPFRRCVFFQQQAAPAQAAHYLFTEALTAVGRALHPDQPCPPAHPYSTVGVRRVFWPRERLLRGLARRLARETLASWIGSNVIGQTDEAEKAVTRLWRERRLNLSLFRLGVEYGTAQKLGAPVESLIAEGLSGAAGGSTKDGPPLAAAEETLRKLTELLDDGVGAESPRTPGRVFTALSERAADLAAAAEAQLSPLIAGLIERPGQRVAGARQAIQLITDKLGNELGLVERELDEQLVRVKEARAAATELLEVIPTGGKSVARRGTVSPEFPTRAANWAKAQYELLRDQAVANGYRRILAAIPEYENEIVAVVNRIAALSREPEEDFETDLPADGVCEYLFPYGATSAEAAIDKLAAAFGDAACREFDDLIQGRVRAAGKGILQVAFKPDWGLRLSRLVQGEAERFVEGKANRLSASQALVKHFSSRSDLQSYMEGLVCSADSALPGVEAPMSMSVLATPDDQAGQQIAGLVRRQIPDTPVVTAPANDELILVRESRGISLTTLLEERFGGHAEPPPPPAAPVNEEAMELVCA